MKPTDLATQLKQLFLQGQGVVTQPAGAYNPGVEKFSGGVNYGTDIGVGVGTPINLPKGNYSILDAYSGAKGPGYIGNSTNSGYGNSVLLKDNSSGNTYRVSHLSQVGVKPGTFQGGLLGYSGATGNVTGPHLDVEAYDPSGRILTENGFGGVLKTLQARGQASNPSTGNSLDPNQVLSMARQKYGNSITAISNNPQTLLAKNPNAKIIKITI